MTRPMVSGVLFLALAVPAQAQWLRVGSANVAESGDTAEVCVSLESLGRVVAGTQNDLVWDGACVTLESADSCAVASGIGKSLHGRVLGNRDFAYRGLVLSLEDLAPIPDGTLYCCRFVVDAMPHSCCAVSIENVGLSDDKGNALGVAAGPPARLCVGPFDGTPLADNPTRMPTPTPTPTARTVPANDGMNGQDTASASGSSGGCQTAPSSPDAAWPMSVIAALLILRRRASSILFRRRG